MIDTGDPFPSDMIPAARRAAVDALVGSRLRLCREMLGWTIDDMADALGCEAALLRAYEAGHVRVSPVDLTGIARLFQIPVVWFFVGFAGPEGDRPGTVGAHRAAMLSASEEKIADQHLALLAEELAKIRDPSIRIMLIDMARNLARRFQ
jgi:transcriptional regulator with XRE-family HTH domain